MARIVVSYVSIFCLLILVSANTITTSLEKEPQRMSMSDWSEDGDAEEQTNPAPIEEDTSGQDDDTSKLVSHFYSNLSKYSVGNLIFSSCFLTSFHFLEIISPPPQA